MRCRPSPRHFWGFSRFSSLPKRAGVPPECPNAPKRAGYSTGRFQATAAAEAGRVWRTVCLHKAAAARLSISCLCIMTKKVAVVGTHCVVSFDMHFYFYDCYGLWDRGWNLHDPSPDPHLAAPGQRLPSPPFQPPFLYAYRPPATLHRSSNGCPPSVPRFTALPLLIGSGGGAWHFALPSPPPHSVCILFDPAVIKNLTTSPQISSVASSQL